MADALSPERLAERYRMFALAEGAGSPLYHHLASAIADDDDLLSLLARVRRGQQLPVALFAAVHDRVLAGEAPSLAPYYASVGGAEPAPEAFPAFRRFCLAEQGSILDTLARRNVQTNEVRRSVGVHLALRVATARTGADAVGLVELGTSAGLLLELDRYRYVVDGAVTGDPTSSLTLTTECRGPLRPPPDRPATVVSRVGVDTHPLDPSDPDDARWLRACLWPDQPERDQRLRTALRIATDHPAERVEGDAVDDGPELAAEVADDLLPVVFHTWALAYIGRDRRRMLAERLARLGRSRPLVEISLEAPGIAPAVDLQDPGDVGLPDGIWDEAASVLGLVVHHGNGTVTSGALARLHAHLEWIAWAPVRGLDQSFGAR